MWSINKPTTSFESLSFTIRAYDERCNYWCKIIRAGDPLPLPSEIFGAANIPCLYCQLGEDELFVGDIAFEGEQNHHRLKWGWCYWVHFVNRDCQLITYRSSFSEQKAAAKQLGLTSELLTGSGDLAGAVRVAHALRQGMVLPGQLV